MAAPRGHSRPERYADAERHASLVLVQRPREAFVTHGEPRHEELPADAPTP
ncbi:hypothetical protein [Streptomyces sp. HPF1205]|uniref:hypothetical protein n=1 Tax=Streptomyces sp. HPF1205 TaxID=2873262 RepID=UPI001CEDDBD3|nr:hypothetical protein [Streptomyces sp. HPF1205]